MQNSPKCSFSAKGLMSSQGPMYWTHLSFSRSGSRVKRPWQWLHKPPTSLNLASLFNIPTFLKIKLEIRHLHISHNTPCLSPSHPPPQKKKLHNLCFFISPGYYKRFDQKIKRVYIEKTFKKKNDVSALRYAIIKLKSEKVYGVKRIYKIWNNT